MSAGHGVFGKLDVFVALCTLPSPLVGDAHGGKVKRVVGVQLAGLFPVFDCFFMLTDATIEHREGEVR